MRGYVESVTIDILYLKTPTLGMTSNRTDRRPETLGALSAGLNEVAQPELRLGRVQSADQLPKQGYAAPTGGARKQYGDHLPSKLRALHPSTLATAMLRRTRDCPWLLSLKGWRPDRPK